jgi:hypothetical protein
VFTAGTAGIPIVWLTRQAAWRKLEAKMEIHELIVEMKLLERRLTLYEEKYGILSEDFYAALTRVG